MLKRIGIVVLAIVLLTAPAFAGFETSPWKTAGGSYSDQALGKLGFGLTNAFLGWTEIFTESFDAGSKGGEKFAAGLGNGLINAVLDTVEGALHTVTFFLPQLDVPLPEGGTDVLK